MKLTPLHGLFLALACSSPLHADFVVPFAPAVAGSIHDEPIDGIGDFINALPMSEFVSRSASSEDRVIQEFSVSGINMVEFAGAFFTGRIEALDMTDVGQRTFHLYAYAANGSVDLPDFQVPAVFVGSVQYHPPLDTSIHFFLDASAQVDALLVAGATEVGLRIEAANSVSPGDEVNAEWGSLEIAQCTTTQGVLYCAGTNALCPCGLGDPGGAGCMNSSGVGAALLGTGSTSFSNDTLGFEVSGAPALKPGLLLRGNNQISVPAADGLLCVAGGSMRSHVQVIGAAGTASFTTFNGSPFATVANSGSPTNFQFWYRDPSATCSGQGFNFSNGVSVFYQP